MRGDVSAALIAVALALGNANAGAALPAYEIVGDGIPAPLAAEAGDPGRGRALVIAHDAATIQLLSEDHTQLRLYALDGIPRESVPDTFSTQYAPVFSEHVQFAIHDDLLATPAERDRPTAKAGLRSALRLPLRIDGRRIIPAYLFEVKKPEESKYPWDYYKTIATISPEDAAKPLEASECPLVKK
jgi:hypothetical protein